MLNTKILMVSTSLILATAGIFALFAPDKLLAMLQIPLAEPLLVLVQLMGALYFSFALLNWTAKDSTIGGIYARPVSVGNFSHFFSGTLLLVKYQLFHEFSVGALLALIVYALLAAIFYWLVFHATGVVVDNHGR
jgi:hypothetical protein